MNLAAKWYGSIAEIGGGQEVARWFFNAGGAAGTVAKTISAYDTAISDGIYGTAKRYVSRERLDAMLENEFAHVSRQLAQNHGDRKCFFAFANTVATRRFQSPGHGRGWIGIRFQTRPHEEPSQITLHAHLLDTMAEREQDALGVLGINLIYGALLGHERPLELISGLMDDLSRERVEIDMVKFSGPAFTQVDNRLMSLQLVELGFTDAAMFTSAGEVVQPSEVLYKKPILVHRGTFRPATNLTLDVLERARELFLKEPGVAGHDPVIVAEMTLHSLIPGPEVGHSDFLARAEILGELGFDVLVSRFAAYYEVTEYLAGYTDRPIGLAIGLPALRKIADEEFYPHLSGGVLEAVGRLYKKSVKLFVYPSRDGESGQIQLFDDIVLPPPWQHLHDLLRELGRMKSIDSFNEMWLCTKSTDVLEMIENNDPSWETLVPPKVAALIKSKNLFRTAAAGRTQRAADSGLVAVAAS
jgi:hypothetical protein